ncbi:MAG: trehalose-phosphatase [Thermomicrobiales bacterium]|nr:trehalose-phosphatase [Thermomicrobiales bacterium]
MIATPPVDPGLVARCRAVLAHAPAGLLSDIDGTLSAIAPTPAEAFVANEIKVSLAALAERLALVGVVSGRSTEVGAAMIGVPDLLYIGNHGMERLHRGVWVAHADAAAYREALGSALEEIGAAVAATAFAPIVLIEHKGLTGTVHYRLAADADAAHAELAPIVAAAAARHGLRLTEGRLILELRPPVTVTKGTAVATLIEEFGLRGALFLGDDLTDADAFLAIRRARERSGIDALAIGVLGPETPKRVRETMDVGIDGVPAVAALLAALAAESDVEE